MGHAHQEGDDEGPGVQLKRRRDPLDYALKRVYLVSQGLAEITSRCFGYPAGVLDGHGPVQTHFHPHGIPVCLGGVFIDVKEPWVPGQSRKGEDEYRGGPHDHEHVQKASDSET